MAIWRIACTLAALLALAACAGLPPAAGKGEPKVVSYHGEDDHVRIDEQRVRGQLTRATVTPKAEGTAPYEVLPPAGGQDPSISRDTAGQRVWSVLKF
jgi:hypothetical protein